uniref:Uncharacterized protein n=1 Tax=Romanomermis culicivorax TaxID=13658 RepID=A0A915IJ86_ROMCU
MQYNDPTLPPLRHEVDDVWIERVAADQPLCDGTYRGTHYRPTDETRNRYRVLRMYVVPQRRQPQIAPNQLDESHPQKRTIFCQQTWNVCLQSVHVTPDHIQQGIPYGNVH